MTAKNYTFIQSLSINDNEVGIDRVVSFAYTEPLDLSGPSIILELRDEQSFIRDDYELSAGSEVVIEMGDIFGVGDQLFEETFIVATFPVENNIIKIEGFQQNCAALKVPAGKPLFFVDKPPAAILNTLLPGLTIDCSVSGRGTYHLNQGKTPARLLRDMARDNGAACWICRGTVYFKALVDIAGADPLLKVGLNSLDADTEIARYNKINTKALFERSAHKNYCSWSTTDRIKRSAIHKDKPSVLVAYPLTTRQLANRCLYVQPSLDIVVLGDSRFMPGVNFDIEIIKLSGDAALDESVEANLFVKSITHFTQGRKYNNRMILGAVNGE